ncbi:MAG: TonB-dependent receptor, partial [Acidobacteria bacterium]|nr:TonB-dependent receptor [Acidobacteriota bacterium]
MNYRYRLEFFVLVAAALLPQACFGQAFTASLTGLVTDPTGGVVTGATMKLKNTATAEERQAKTGDEGRYTFSQLLPGVYELTGEAQGFRTFVQRNINLQASRSAALNVTFQLGDLTQRVEIAEAAVQLDTQTANQSLTLSRDMVLSLPTNARNPMSLVHATAGVTAPGVGITQATQDQNHDRFGVNGNRSTSTGVLLDGVSVTTGTGWNGLLYSPSVDAVQEVQVIRNSYDAQFGKSGGGVVSIVSKGGSAQFHGGVYEFLRNSTLDANTWTNNRTGQRKPIFQRSQFGGNLSGPISRSKRVVFFGNYEGLRQGSPATSIVNLPTPLQRQGDFSETRNPNGTLSVIYNPFSLRANPSGTGSIRDALPGNRIPASMIDPVGKAAVGLYPAPNNPGDPFTNARNYAATGKSTALTDRVDARIDWARSEKHTMYGRFSRAFRLDNRPPAGVWQSYGGTGPIHGNRRYHIAVGNTFIPNPTWVVNLLLGHGSWAEKQRSDTYGRDGTEIGLPASLVSQFDVKTIPQIYPSGYSNISHSRDLNNVSRVDNLQLNVTKEKGVHSFKFGFGWESDKGTGGGLYSADFNFSRGMTSGPTAATNSSTSGDGIASMLLGTGSGGSVQKPALGASNRVYYSLYFQDTWRIGKRLTLNPGVRYEIQKPATERYDRYSNFFYDVVNPLGAKVGMNLRGGLVFLDKNNRYSWNPNYRDFAPRLGLSYKLAEKLVLRAGYGIFFPTVLGGGDMTGFSATTSWVYSRGGDGITPQDLFRNPYPTGLILPIGNSQGLLTNVGQSAGSYQRDHPSGYVQNYSADFQFELSPSTVVQLGYTGHQARKLALSYSLNDNQ